MFSNVIVFRFEAYKLFGIYVCKYSSVFYPSRTGCLFQYNSSVAHQWNPHILIEYFRSKQILRFMEIKPQRVPAAARQGSGRGTAVVEIIKHTSRAVHGSFFFRSFSALKYCKKKKIKNICTILIPSLENCFISSRYAVNMLLLACAKHVVPLGIEPRTLCFLGRRANHYGMEKNNIK